MSVYFEVSLGRPDPQMTHQNGSLAYVYVGILYFQQDMDFRKDMSLTNRYCN